MRRQATKPTLPPQPSRAQRQQRRIRPCRSSVSAGGSRPWVVSTDTRERREIDGKQTRKSWTLEKDAMASGKASAHARLPHTHMPLAPVVRSHHALSACASGPAWILNISWDRRVACTKLASRGTKNKERTNHAWCAGVQHFQARAHPCAADAGSRQGGLTFRQKESPRPTAELCCYSGGREEMRMTERGGAQQVCGRGR